MPIFQVIEKQIFLYESRFQIPEQYLPSSLQFQKVQYTSQSRCTPSKIRKQSPSRRHQLHQLQPRILKTARLLQNANRVPLQSLVIRLLTQNVHQFRAAAAAAAAVCCATPDTVHNRIRELALGDILSKALVLCVLLVLEILVVVSDLEDYS